MGKRLRFQTKLMLVIGCLVAATTTAMIVATQAKIRQAYTRQFERDFEAIVGHLERDRAERLEESMILSDALAAHPYVAARLRGTETTEMEDLFWKEYLELLTETAMPQSRPTRPSRPTAGRPPQGRPAGAGGQDLLSRIGRLAILHPDGEIEQIVHPKAPESSRFRKRNIPAEEAKADTIGLGTEKSILYLPYEPEGGPAVVQEMTAIPVNDPETGKALGFFLRGTSAETEAQRFLERFQKEFGMGTRVADGIWIEDRLYSRTMPPGLAEALSESITVQTGLNPNERSRFEADASGRPYLVYLDPLGGENRHQSAYHAAAFSLETLNRELAELRLRGSGIGGTVLLLGLAAAFFLSRSLARPIQELSVATDAVRQGNLDHRVTVRSRDEIGALGESFNEMAEELKQKAVFRELLGKVSDETVAQALIEGTLDLELGGEIREVAVLFCDIRGFTAMTEKMPPSEVIALLNEHMSAMTEVVREHHGVVDKFVGDEIMAVFGALKNYGNDAANAAACALDMIRKREELNAAAGPHIEIGVGIASGEAVAGCMGSQDRLNYTVLGARVNLAARLCGTAGPMEAIADEPTRTAWGGKAKSVGSLDLKGFSEPVEAFRLENDETPKYPNTQKAFER